MENCRDELSLGVRKPNNPYITTSIGGGYQEKSSLIQKQSPAYSFVKHNRNSKRDQILSDETKKCCGPIFY